MPGHCRFRSAQSAHAHRHCPSPPAWRQGPPLAVRAHDPAGAGNRLPRGGRIRPARDAVAAGRSLLVPGLRLRAGLRLAFQRRDHHRLRRAQGGHQGPGAGSGPVRRRWQGRSLAQDARANPVRLRQAGAGSRAAGAGQQAFGQGGQHRPAGRLPALSSQFLLYPGRTLERGPAGHERRQRHGAPLPLDQRKSGLLRRGAPCRPKSPAPRTRR